MARHTRFLTVPTEAFPWNDAPRYLIRDRDSLFGAIVSRRLRAMGIRDKPIAPSSFWQNAYAERLIGSIRRECIDCGLVLREARIGRLTTMRQSLPQRNGAIRLRAILGGLHHHYVGIYFSIHTGPKRRHHGAGPSSRARGTCFAAGAFRGPGAASDTWRRRPGLFVRGGMMINLESPRAQRGRPDRRRVPRGFRL